ncbi:hypothetical protein D3C72_1269740 [compost metagenome]
MKVHRRVGTVEIALDAEAAEFLRLDVDPALREFAAFLAEFVDRDLVLVLALGAIGFLDLPFDRQAVAIPARNVIGVVAAHLERAGDDVLQDLVQCMADVDVAVGIGRAVMQHEFLAAGGGGAQALVEAHLLPALHRFRFLLRQASAHRKIRLRQIEGGGVVQFFCGVAHNRTVVARRVGRAVSISKRGKYGKRHDKCHDKRQNPGPSGSSERAEGRANNSANLNCKLQPVLGHGRLFMRFSGKKEEKSDGNIARNMG